ncbi:MAG: hypothetical protein GY943_18910 [Chloroflexi bacterium]|nr:hypothetical protein [Chloroflexota bacterium]
MSQETITHKNSSRINASFQQKSSGISLVVINTIGIYYFIKVGEMAREGSGMPAGFKQLVIMTVILIVVAEIVLQTVLTIGAGGASTATQRDHEAVAKAKLNGYGILAVGTLATFGSVFFEATPFIMANIALFSFVLAEVTRFVSQLIYYRRSAA